MKKRYRIELRDPAGGKLGEIKRVLTAEACGNFIPLFCIYKGERYLVKSEAGDLSDPFRRTEAYAQSFYITIKGEA